MCFCHSFLDSNFFFGGSSEVETRPQSWQGFHVWKLEVLPMKSVAVTSRALDQNVFRSGNVNKIGKKRKTWVKGTLWFLLWKVLTVFWVDILTWTSAAMASRFTFWNCSANFLKSLLYEIWPKESANITMKWWSKKGNRLGMTNQPTTLGCFNVPCLKVHAFLEAGWIH